MSDPIPDRMRALVLPEYREEIAKAIDALKVEYRPVPVPSRGQVLVKIDAASCNPSDLLLLQGKYGSLKTLPTVPGWEGAGTVVASGGGLLAWWLKGRRVACGLQGDRDGTWAEYALAGTTECIPLKQRLETEEAASLIINPLTAMGLLDTAQRAGHRAAVQTAGASQLGRMLLVMAGKANFPIVNVVRREDQVELLKSLGTAHVLNSSREDFVEQLRTACADSDVTAAFEAVSGDMTGILANAMPPGATVYVYGALSEEHCGNIDPIQVIFHDKTVTGFYLGTWLRRRGALGILRAAGRVQQMMIDGLIATRVQRRVGLDEASDGLKQYVDHMTDGKVLILPHSG